MRIDMNSLDWEQQHELVGRALVPRPVALISTVGEDGVYNAAPFSAIAAFGAKPSIIAVSIGLRRGQKKDTQRNIEISGDFVVNIMDDTFIKPTIQTSANYPRGVDEMKVVGFTAVASDRVKSPRIAEAQVNLECRVVQKLELGEGEYLRTVVLGEVLVAHVKDHLLADGRIDPSLMKVIGRVGGGFYCRTSNVFRLTPSATH